jgi:cytochrome oxidase assembly protein ShyY1
MTASTPRARGVLGPSLTALVAFAILVSLGVWQLNRLHWKEALIATLHERLATPPVPLPPPAAWAGLNAATDEFRRVQITADFDAAAPAFLFTGTSALRADIKAPGYFVFAPARLPDGRTIVVNTGYVPEGRKDVRVGGRREIVGYLRWPEGSGWFVSDHDQAGEVWFVRDPLKMAQAKGWGEVAPFYIDQEGPLPAGELPRPGPLTVNLRNNHLGYVWTWFGLAGTLVGVFAFWLWGALRKSSGKGAKPSL